MIDTKKLVSKKWKKLQKNFRGEKEGNNMKIKVTGGDSKAVAISVTNKYQRAFNEGLEMGRAIALQMGVK